MTQADMRPGNGVHGAESLQLPHGTNITTVAFPPGIYLSIRTISLSLLYHGRKGVTVGVLGQPSALLFIRVAVTLLALDTEPHYSRTWLHGKHGSGPKDELVCSTPIVHTAFQSLTRTRRKGHGGMG